MSLTYLSSPNCCTENHQQSLIKTDLLEFLQRGTLTWEIKTIKQSLVAAWMLMGA